MNEQRIIMINNKYCDVFGVSGTVEDWRMHVGSQCRGNSRLIQGVCGAAAGPLLKPMNEPGCGYHVNGSAQSGKTITTMAAGSFWGGSSRPTGYMRSWRATSNGLEGIACTHNDGLLVLDELSQANASEAPQIAYMLANGVGKTRAGRNGVAPPSAQWRLMFLSSGEMGLGDKMAEAGKRTYAGLEVRMIDVPANAGAGHGVFEDLHGCSDGAAFANRLKAAALRYYGAPVRRYVELLAQMWKNEGDAFPERLNEYCEQFIKGYLPKTAGPQIRSICRRFALCAAAGTLATKLGITGWEPEDAEWGVSRCFNAWLEQRGIVNDIDLDNGVREVIAFIERYGNSRFEAAWETGTESEPLRERIIDRAGFRRRDDGCWHYYILPEQWRKITAGYRSAELTQEMLNRQLLMSDGKGKSSVSMRVPGHGQMRLYHVAPAILLGGNRST